MKKRDVLLNTEDHRGPFNQFADAFRAIEAREHWRDSEILNHWLDAAFRSLRGRLLLGKSHADNEAEYMRIVARCRDPQQTMQGFSVMLGAAMLALRAAPIDFIGPVFSTLSASASMGQFFTPYHLSRLMAEMTIGSAEEMLDGKPWLDLCEPSCGVAGMCLATNEVLRARGIDPATHAHWIAVDVDYRAMCGAYLQLALTDSSAVVVHGNTLSLEQWMATETPAAVLFPKRLPPVLPALAPPPDRKETMGFTRRAVAAA